MIPPPARSLSGETSPTFPLFCSGDKARRIAASRGEELLERLLPPAEAWGLALPGGGGAPLSSAAETSTVAPPPTPWSSRASGEAPPTVTCVGRLAVLIIAARRASREGRLPRLNDSALSECGRESRWASPPRRGRRCL